MDADSATRSVVEVRRTSAGKRAEACPAVEPKASPPSVRSLLDDAGGRTDCNASPSRSA